MLYWYPSAGKIVGFVQKNWESLGNNVFEDESEKVEIATFENILGISKNEAQEYLGFILKIGRVPLPMRLTTTLNLPF